MAYSSSDWPFADFPSRISSEYLYAYAESELPCVPNSTTDQTPDPDL